MTDATSLGHVPEKEKWEFDEKVAACFADMLERSIPDYAEMRRLVTQLATRFALPGTLVVDLGSSRGDALASLLEVPALASCEFVAAETAPAMLKELRARWPLEGSAVRVEDLDLRKKFGFYGSSVILSVLTLMFTPLEHRLRILRDVWDSLLPGGAFVLVEKVLGSSHAIDEALLDAYYEKKRASGYSQEEIDRKRLSLEGVLVPLTAKWNEGLLRGAGFRDVDCFWRNMNFAAWVAIK